MFDIIPIGIIISVIMVTIGQIHIKKKNYRQKSSDRLSVIGKRNVLKNGMIFNLIVFALYLSIFIVKSIDLYETLNQEYLNHVFQLFSIHHLDTLTNYFYEQEMLSEYFSVNQFRNEFLFLLVTIVVEFCYFSYRFYLTRIDNFIHSEGLFIDGHLNSWETIKAYQWTDQKEFFTNKPLKRLKIKSNSSSSLAFERKQSIDVSMHEKQRIDYYLKQHQIEEKILTRQEGKKNIKLIDEEKVT